MSKSKTDGAKKAPQKAGDKTWPVYVRKSGVHGKGLFAAGPIPADVMIIPLEGVPTTKDGIYVLWWSDEDGEHGLEVTNDARYVNHASKPNAAYYDDGVYSLRKIKKGEEITHHYGDGWADVE